MMQKQQMHQSKNLPKHTKEVKLQQHFLNPVETFAGTGITAVIIMGIAIIINIITIAIKIVKIFFMRLYRKVQPFLVLAK